MKYKKTTLSLAVIASAIIFINYFSLHRHVASTISSNPANDGIKVVARYQWLLNPGTIVYDLRSVSGEKSATDVNRVLFGFAEKLKNREYKKVILSYKGKEKFQLDGAYFKKVGEEYKTQNPIYLIRKLPEHLYKPDGSKAFKSWEGGWLGVFSNQMKDYNSFNQQWFIEDFLKQ